MSDHASPELPAVVAPPPVRQHYRVLIVDDIPENRTLLCTLISHLGHSAVEAADGLAAIQVCTAKPPDLVLLDIEMPELDGRQVLSMLKSDAKTARIPIVMVSGLGDLDTVVTCIKLGADDYFPKPFDATLLKARIDALLERKRLQDREHQLIQQLEQYNSRLQELVAAQVQQIAAGHVSTILAMSKLAECRDPETGEHLERMREFCRILARQLQFHPMFSGLINDKYVDAIYAASPLHDIGKVGIPDYVLLKPGPHTPDERKLMEQHTVIGAQTLREVHKHHKRNDLVNLGIEIAQAHHEKWDGTGYPDGIAGEDIPLAARILALADVYDALRAKRVYKPAFTHEEARAIIMEGSGVHFDPAVVQAFLDTEAEFVEIRDKWTSDH
jgi:putative two-component system response regulator